MSLTVGQDYTIKVKVSGLDNNQYRGWTGADTTMKLVEPTNSGARALATSVIVSMIAFANILA